MQLRDPFVWATVVDENPLPRGCPADSAGWATWASTAPAADRRALARAVVPIIAERWADAMETAMHARRRGVGDVATLAFGDVLAELAPLGLSNFQFGCIVAMLVACWAYAPERDGEDVLMRAGAIVSCQPWGVVIS